MDRIKIKRTHSSDKDFSWLITQLDKDLDNRNPDTQTLYNKHNHIESLETVIIAYDNIKPIGCGCFKPYNDATVEIKRMFMRPEYRGKGVSKCLLRELESWAYELGFSRLVLETGKRQPEAIGLYEKYGFKRIKNYGPYVNLSNSICFEKNHSVR